MGKNVDIIGMMLQTVDEEAGAPGILSGAEYEAATNLVKTNREHIQALFDTSIKDKEERKILGLLLWEFEKSKDDAEVLADRYYYEMGLNHGAQLARVIS